MPPRSVYVLRIGHRRVRDHRVTTHVALVARAFGADGIFLEKHVEESVVRTVARVCASWGGDFKVEKVEKPLRLIEEWRSKGGAIVHLTMYGLNIADGNVLSLVKTIKNDLLVVVGGEKVPGVLFELADYNIAVGNQPHSEVAALAIFLDRIFDGKELLKSFPNARIWVEPCANCKKVHRLDPSP
ncbi:MAG: tRNA (cytidine(56)-2'-O)-methyltransferase [Infirmifilum sp.]